MPDGNCISGRSREGSGRALNSGSQWVREYPRKTIKDSNRVTPPASEWRIMQQQIQTRLEVLKTEFETGQAKLRELEMQQSHLRETLLRISGAIQVLEEMLQPAKPDEGPAPHGSLPAEPSDVGKG